MKFLMEAPSNYFYFVFEKSKLELNNYYRRSELDNEERSNVINSLTEESLTEEDENSNRTMNEFQLVSTITQFLLDTVSSPLIATFNGVAAWRNEQETVAILTEHYNSKHDVNFGKKLTKFLAARRANLDNVVETTLEKSARERKQEENKAASTKKKKERAKRRREKSKFNKSQKKLKQANTRDSSTTTTTERPGTNTNSSL